MSDKRKQPRRLHGEGTVEERRPGSWRFKCPDGQGGRFASESIYPSREDALAGLAAFRAKIVAGELVPVEGMTLADYYEHHFLPRLESRVERGIRRKGTLGFYASHWPRLSGLANRPLKALDVPAITRWVNDLGRQVKRPESYLAVLRAILQEAVSIDFVLKANPAREVRYLDAAPSREESDRAPTPEEAAALLSCEAIPHPDRLIIAFALGAGLRPGEWRSLELSDLHLKAKVPYVLVQYGSEDRGPTKTGKKRKVPLIGLAHRALTEWLAQLPQYAPKNPLGLVFPTKRGKQRTNEPFGRRKPLPGEKRKSKVHRWHDFLAAAGIDRRLTPHGLRHGCATGLLTGWLGAKLDPWAVQVFVGHDRLATTERYLHHGSSDLFDAVRESANQSPDGPEKKNAGLGSGLFSKESETGGEECRRVDSNHRKSRETPADGDEKPQPAPAGTAPGPVDWREVYDRIHSGDWPDETEARHIASVARAMREEADPVLRAVRRVENTPAWQAGLFDLVRLLVEEEQRRDASREGGAS